MKIKSSDVFEAAGFAMFAWAAGLWFGLAAAVCVIGVGLMVFGLASDDSAIKLPKVPKVRLRRKRDQ